MTTSKDRRSIPEKRSETTKAALCAPGRWAFSPGQRQGGLGDVRPEHTGAGRRFAAATASTPAASAEIRQSHREASMAGARKRGLHEDFRLRASARHAGIRAEFVSVELTCAAKVGPQARARRASRPATPSALPGESGRRGRRWPGCARCRPWRSKSSASAGADAMLDPENHPQRVSSVPGVRA